MKALVQVGSLRNCWAEVPKTIIIENWKIGCLLRFMQVGVLIFVFFQVIVQEAWLTEIPQADFVGGMTFWASSDSNDVFTEKTNSDFMQNWCVKPENYDYQYGDPAFPAYKDHSCVGLPPHERWMKGESELFLPVSFHEKYMLQANFHKDLIMSNGGSCEAAMATSSPCVNQVSKLKQQWKTLPRGLGLLGCECELASGNFFVAGVSAVSLGMEIFYHVKSSEGVKTEGFSTKDVTVQDGVEKPGLLVILQDQHQRKVEEYKPGGGRAIVIPMVNVMKYAGVDLDQAMTNTLENVNTTAKAKYPIVRITGVTISAHITYMNTHSDHKEDWDGPVAIISLSHQKIWTTRHETDHEKPLAQFPPSGKSKSQLGQYRYRAYAGVAVKFSASGIWKHTHLSNFGQTIGSCIPFISIPILIVSVFALNCLGPIGNIYKRAGRQRVGLRGHKGNAAVRMAVAANAYDQLKGSDPKLTISRLRDQMRKILEQSHFLDEETNQKLDAQYHELIVQQMIGELDADCNGDISLEEFMECAVGHELVGPKQLVDCHLQAGHASFHKRVFFSEGTRIEGGGNNQTQVSPATSSKKASEEVDAEKGLATEFTEVEVAGQTQGKQATGKGPEKGLKKARANAKQAQSKGPEKLEKPSEEVDPEQVLD